MIRVLLAINLGFAVAVTFAIIEAIAPPPRRRRTVAEVLKDQRRDDLAEMIVDLDLNVASEKIDAIMFGGLPSTTITITGRYGNWMFDTITEDAVN